MALIERPEAVFDFTNCGLSGKIPKGIKVKYIRLWDNQYTEFPFEYCLQDYTTLNMQRNYITGEIPDSILDNKEAMDRLQILTLNQYDGCKFSNAPEGW